MAFSPRQGGDVGDHSVSFPARTPTRTLAILAKSACNTHRSAIQAQITSNGFAIVDECLEQWSSKEDVDFLRDLLQGEEHADRWSRRLTDAPIYLMVLERYRAAEMWKNLCGPDDDDEGSLSSGEKKGGIRARYGADALYASAPSRAETQIALCFPELAIEQLADDDLANVPTTISAVNSNGAFVVREDGDIVYDDRGRAFDANTGEALELQQEVSLSSALELSPARSKNGSAAGFKARPLPSSYKQTTPINQPRLSRAAALRMGIAVPETTKKRAMSVTSSNADANVGISGVPKSAVTVPRSLAAPSIAPRMNRNALARTSKVSVGGGATTSSTVSSSEAKERRPVDFSNTPGHKRMSISGTSTLASLAAPTVVPRLNKAAAARVANATAGAAPVTPSSFMRSTRTTSASATSFVRSPSSVHRTASPSPANIRQPMDFSTTPGHKRTSMSSAGPSTGANTTLRSLQAPSITPRANRASLARTSVGGVSVVMDGISKMKLATPDDPIRSASRMSGVFASPPSGKENVRMLDHRPASSLSTVRRDRQPVDFSNTPGHKRSTSALGNRIASLAQPTIVPRLNTATQKRLSVGGATATANAANGLGNGGHVTSTRVRVKASGPPPSAFRM